MFCTPGIIVSQISGIYIAYLAILCRNFTLSLHTRQCHTPVFRQTFASRAMLCLRFGTDFWKTEVITLIIQTDLSTSGTRCSPNHPYHRKTKMNCLEIQTCHTVSRMPCFRFQVSHDGRGLSIFSICET